jgi:hypothetical protein
MCFLSNRANINLDLVTEINEQIILSKASLIQIKQSKSFSNDITFISIIDLKISYCEKTLSFIKEKYQTIEKQLPNNGPSILRDHEIIKKDYKTFMMESFRDYLKLITSGH